MALSVKLATAEEGWSCHCCTARNDPSRSICRVCGRPESYVQQGYRLPLHGKNSTLFRPSQVLTVLENIHEVDSEQWSSLHSACASGNYAVVKELLGLKAKTDVRTNNGQTPLHLAVYSGSVECVRELLKYNAVVNVVTRHEKITPLHLACKHQSGPIAQLLIEHGAEVNARNIIQRTPLHLAAETGRVDIGNLLLTSGADKDALDMHGWSARQVAELHGHRDFQELIIRESMTEKQVIIKELPAAEWHSDLWYQVSRMHDARRAQHETAVKSQKENDALLASLAQSRQDKIIAQRRAERRKEIEEYTANKNAVKALTDQYNEKLQLMRQRSALLRAQEALMGGNIGNSSKPGTAGSGQRRIQSGGASGGPIPGSGGGSKPNSAVSLAELRILSGAGAPRQATAGSPPGSAPRSAGSRGVAQLAAMDLSKGYPFALPSRITSAGLNAISASPAAAPAAQHSLEGRS